MAKVFTIGHSNRKWSDFTCILKDNHVDLLVDVRRYPSSRACPQFNKKQMITYLQKKSVSYIHIEKLGGRWNKFYTKGDQHTDNNNNNAGSRNKSFGAYANYKATTSFREDINELLSLMKEYSNYLSCVQKQYHGIVIEEW